jgi:hypothetical protein
MARPEGEIRRGSGRDEAARWNTHSGELLDRLAARGDTNVKASERDP